MIENKISNSSETSMAEPAKGVNYESMYPAEIVAIWMHLSSRVHIIIKYKLNLNRNRQEVHANLCTMEIIAPENESVSFGWREINAAKHIVRRL